MVSDLSYERYFWAVGLSTLLVPIAFYVFCRKRITDRGIIHRGLPREEPPPYRSMELTTLTHNSEEGLAEAAGENHELNVRQAKESLVQAVPFCQPKYETELLEFDNNQDAIQEEPESVVEEDRVIPFADDLHDENTMPSDWAPAETNNNGNNQLMNIQLPEPEVVSESDDTCEPASKRFKMHNGTEEEPCNTQLNINLFINNNVTIHKPS